MSHNNDIMEHKELMIAIKTSLPPATGTTIPHPDPWIFLERKIASFSKYNKYNFL